MRVTTTPTHARTAIEVAIDAAVRGIVGKRPGFDSGSKIAGLAVTKNDQIKGTTFKEAMKAATGKLDYEGATHAVSYMGGIGYVFMTIKEVDAPEANVAKLMNEAAQLQGVNGAKAECVRFVGEIKGAKTCLLVEGSPEMIDLTARTGIIAINLASISGEVYGIKDGKVLVRFTDDTDKNILDPAAWDEVARFDAPITGMGKFVLGDPETGELMTVITTADGMMHLIEIDGAGKFHLHTTFKSNLNVVGVVIDQTNKAWLITHGEQTIDGMPFAVIPKAEVQGQLQPYLEAALKEHAFQAKGATA